ncbi:MAG: phosphatase domain-containing protein [Planctomycetota bacterium]
MAPKNLQKAGADVAPAPTETMRKDKVLWLSIVGYLALIGGLWGLYRWGSLENQQQVAVAAEKLKVTVYDAITTPGTATTLAAKYEKDLPGPANPDKKGLAVVIGLSTTPVVTNEATTNKDGIATVAVTPPKEPGSYLLFSHAKAGSNAYTDRGGTAPALLFVIPADREILICDIDGTITDGEAALKGVNLDPQPGAATAMRKLAEKYAVIYLTARDDMLLNKSRDWLDQHSFPRAPVICRDWTLSSLPATGAFKKRAIAQLKNKFSQIKWAIGNSGGDKEAYAEHKLPHIIIDGEDTEVVNGVQRYGVTDWRKVAKIILGE